MKLRPSTAHSHTSHCTSSSVSSPVSRAYSAQLRRNSPYNLLDWTTAHTACFHDIGLLICSEIKVHIYQASTAAYNPFGVLRPVRRRCRWCECPGIQLQLQLQLERVSPVTTKYARCASRLGGSDYVVDARAMGRIRCAPPERAPGARWRDRSTQTRRLASHWPLRPGCDRGGNAEGSFTATAAVDNEATTDAAAILLVVGALCGTGWLATSMFWGLAARGVAAASCRAELPA